MPDYQKGKIYKIVDHTNDDVYYGSSCEPILSRRLANHVGKYKQYQKGKCNKYTSFKILENGNYDIILVESYPCKSSDELRSREQYYIVNNDCINKNIPNRTQKEWEKANSEDLKTKKKEYQLKNKDKIASYKKEYGKEYRNKHKEKLSLKCKEYDKNHKTEKKEYDKKRSQLKKDLIFEAFVEKKTRELLKKLNLV